MNYLDLVLFGYKTTNDFPQYLYREYQKAVKENYSFKEFFEGCKVAIGTFASMINEQVDRHSEMYYKAIDIIENDTNRTEVQKEIDIEKAKIELNHIDKSKFGISLAILTKNTISGYLYYHDVVSMMEGAIAAIELIDKDRKEQQNEAPKNMNVEFSEVYEEEVTEERKAKLYADLNKIIGIPQKIRFLQKEKLNYLKNLKGRTLEASGSVIAGGFPNAPFLFDRFIDLVIEELKLEAKGPVVTIEGLIRPELINRLSEVEVNLNAKIEDWKQGNDKIECAAFCEILYDLGYFIDKKNNRKGPIQFALIRYGIDITVQMGTTKSKARKVHKGKLNWAFK